MIDKEAWAGRLGAGIALFLIASLGGVAAFGWPAYTRWLGSGSAAAWVGALGAVGAIWGSLRAARLQSDRQDRAALAAEMTKRRRQMETLLSMIHYAEAIAVKVHNSVQDKGVVTTGDAFVMRVEVMRAHGQLLALSAHDFTESHILVEALALACGSAELLSGEVSGYLHGAQFGFGDVESLKLVAGHARNHLGNCAANVRYVLVFWNAHLNYPVPPGLGQQTSP